VHSVGENVDDCPRYRIFCELQLINTDSVVTFKIHVTQAGAVYDSEPVQIIDLNVMAIQSDVSWNHVGNVRHLVSGAFWTRLGGANDSQIDPICLWLRLRFMTAVLQVYRYDLH